MAKAKKQEKPIEQRLEETLVLYEKKPYELPSSWCWTKLPYITQIKTGKRDANHAKEDGQYRFYTCSAEYSMADTYAFEGESIIVPGNGDIGLVFYYDGKFEAYQRTYVINGFKGQTKYLYYYFYYKWREKNTYKQFGTAIPYVRMANFEEFEIPLAPLEEQKRIVEIIDKQFAKLDEARDLIQKSLDSFADRKFAIIHKAFTGELTKQWREKNSVIQRKNTVNFLDCIEDMQNGISKRNGKEGKDFIVLRLADLKENRISTDDNRTIKLTETEIKKYQLKENDIIMIRVNGSKEYVGRQILFNMECACAYCDHIIRIQYRKDISPKFMLYFSQTREYKDYILQNLVSSAGQNTISRKGLSRLKLNLPLFEEQEEIVRILDSIFEKEDKSKELLDMLDKIDEMKKSILARAFRGELGTSNPTDEPATDLLRKILEYNNV